MPGMEDHNEDCHSDDTCQNGAVAPTDDRLRTVLHLCLDAFRVLIKSSAEPQKIRSAATSLGNQIRLVEQTDIEDPQLDLLCDLSECLQNAMMSLDERETLRQSTQGVNMHPRKSKAMMEDANDNNEDDGADLLSLSEESNAVRMAQEFKDSCHSLDARDTDSNLANTNVQRTVKRATISNATCKTCGKSFKKKSYLSTHELTHLSDFAMRNPFKCGDCGRRFTSQKSLTTHANLHLPVNQRERFACDTCTRSFSRKTTLGVHMKSHLDTEEKRKPHKCGECGRRYLHPHDLKIHLISHLSVEDPCKRVLECPICGKTFKQLCGLQMHMRIHADDLEVRMPYKCDDCGRRFAQLGTFTRHKITHLPNGDPKKKKVSCEVCGKSCMEKRDIVRHMRSHLGDHDPQKKPFGCEICGKHFSRYSVLATHTKLHLEPEDPLQAIAQRPFECEECGKRFKNEWNLKTHKLTHIDDDDTEKAAIKRPFECEVCGKRFRELGVLTQHMRTHSSSDEVKNPFKCDLCDKRFSQKGILGRHLARHENKREIAKNRHRRTKLCSLCPRIFMTEGELAIHLKRHQDGTVGDSTDDDEGRQEERFQCKMCEKVFVDRKIIYLHITNIHKVSKIAQKKALVKTVIFGRTESREQNGERGSSDGKNAEDLEKNE